MSVQAAKLTAEKLVERLGIRTAPVDVERVAALLDLRVIAADLGEGISGLLVVVGDTASIAVKQTDQIFRKRFTIAHEIGHFILRHHRQRNELVHADPQAQVIYRSARASEGLDRIEVEANQFAASLLMPARLVREQANELGLPLTEADVRKLAKDVFQVSEQAMTIRLNGLGLL